MQLSLYRVKNITKNKCFLEFGTFELLGWSQNSSRDTGCRGRVESSIVPISFPQVQFFPFIPSGTRSNHSLDE